MSKNTEIAVVVTGLIANASLLEKTKGDVFAQESLINTRAILTVGLAENYGIKLSGYESAKEFLRAEKPEGV